MQIMKTFRMNYKGDVGTEASIVEDLDTGEHLRGRYGYVKFFWNQNEKKQVCFFCDQEGQFAGFFLHNFDQNGREREQNSTWIRDRSRNIVLSYYREGRNNSSDWGVQR